MVKPKYIDIASKFNLDRGLSSFDNSQNVGITGKLIKSSDYFDNGGTTTLQIRYSENKKNLYGFSYFLSNDYRIFETGIKIQFKYNSIHELYKAINESCGLFIRKNFKRPEALIKELNISFNNEFQGFLEIY
jgi:hypothetical protein